MTRRHETVQRSWIGLLGLTLVACGGAPEHGPESDAGYEAYREWALSQAEILRPVTPGVELVENELGAEYDMNDPVVKAYQRRAEAEAREAAERESGLSGSGLAEQQEAIVLLQGYGANARQERCVYPGDTWCAVPKTRAIRWNLNRDQNVHPWWMERLKIAISRLSQLVTPDGFTFTEDSSSSDYINILYGDLPEGVLGLTTLMVKSSNCSGYNWWYPSRFRGICKAHDAVITIDSVQVRNLARNEYGLSEREEGYLLEGTILHEFGHALGLGHHGDPAQLMYSSTTPQNMFAWDFTAEEHNMFSVYRP